jgi:1-acyl-sn-glycerol-3-phosphate acyltransferase
MTQKKKEPLPRASPKARPSSLPATPRRARKPRTPKAPTLEVDAVEAPSEAAGEDNLAEQIRALEDRLDRMIEASKGATEPPPASVRQLPSDTGERPVFDTARELLSTDFYLRKWGRLGMRNRSEEVDDFGFDPIYEQKVMPFLNLLYEKYFRVEAEGVDNIPSEGRCVLVTNHSGTLPYDGLMIKTCVKREHPLHRDVRWLAEDFIFHFPFLGSFTNRVGAVRACQENAERLLRQEALVAVFPEGVKGIGKLFRDRYKLQRFGRGGFVKLCLRTQTPVIPVAVVGAEEATPMLLRIEAFSKGLGLPYIPVTPTFPLLGPLGLVPAPTKWKILFGERIDLGDYGAEAAEDEILVARLADQVRGTIQGMLDRAVGDRRSVWFG